ncbi:MAG: hypothetical protein JXA18_15225 [Chitinispirillaceae bacterium]|nr:hypothetical protein [Chitinispirillaceae bacterium]
MASRPTNKMKIRPLLPVAFLIGICNHAGAVDFPDIPNITASGFNELRFADGYDISGGSQRLWKYLTNTTDVRVGVGGLYLKMRFDVEEPSLGYNPPEPVYREYFSRRTIGLEINPFFIEAGHLSTQFGRGLTLSLKEDREIERYSLLDGVYGQLRYSWVTLQGIAGRPVDQRNHPVELLDVIESSEYDPPDTILVLDEADARFRNLIAGLYTEAFFPVDKAPFSILSSGSIGGGLVRYNSNVIRPSSVPNPDPEHPLWYQNRTSLYFPSVALNMARGDFGLSAEHAWMRGAVHELHDLSDSGRGVFDSVYTKPKGISSYISMNAQLFGVSLLAEYKNYYYRKWEAFSRNEVDRDMNEKASEAYKEVSAFLIPPSVRYQHFWHLLNKHLPSNFMADIIGYKFMLNWAPTASSMLTADFSFGGPHDHDSHIRLQKESSYWEAYSEWAQELGDRLNLKVGIDYGKVDPIEWPKVTFRTLACDVSAGPFGERHSFGLVLESQLNDKPFLAEKDSAALMDLILRTVPANTLATYSTYEDTLVFGDLLVPESERSRYQQYAFNLLATLSYHLSPWLSLAITLEHEMLLFKSDPSPSIVTNILSETYNYGSIGMNLKPTPSHTVTIEYGSMSGGKKCTMGTCVDVPPFKGFKLTLVSVL